MTYSKGYILSSKNRKIGWDYNEMGYENTLSTWIYLLVDIKALKAFT